MVWKRKAPGVPASESRWNQLPSPSVALPPTRWGEETLPDGRTLKYWVSPCAGCPAAAASSPPPIPGPPSPPLLIPRRRPTRGAQPGARGATFASCAAPTSATSRASCWVSGAAWAWRTWGTAEALAPRRASRRKNPWGGDTAPPLPTQLRAQAGAGGRLGSNPCAGSADAARPAWEPRAGKAGGAPRPPSGDWAGPGPGGAGLQIPGPGTPAQDH